MRKVNRISKKANQRIQKELYWKDSFEHNGTEDRNVHVTDGSQGKSCLFIMDMNAPRTLQDLHHLSMPSTKLSASCWGIFTLHTCTSNRKSGIIAGGWWGAAKRLTHTFSIVFRFRDVFGPIHALNVFTFWQLCDSHYTVRCNSVVYEEELKTHSISKK